MSAPIETSPQVSGKVDLTRLPLTYTNEYKMDFVLIHAGVVKEYWRDQWLNTREFTIPQPFYIGTHEVTLKQWRDVVGKSSVVSKFSPEGPKADFMKKLPDSVVDQYPVNGITWDEAQVFVYSLNRKSLNKNWHYRLPLAGEWQAACQGGTQNAIHDLDYQFFLKDGPSKTLTRDQACFGRAEDEGPCPVGSFPPNSIGIYDMHGNVAEFLDDGNRGQSLPYRAAMGGLYREPNTYCSILRRLGFGRTDRNPGMGLRVVRVPVLPPE